MQIQPNNFCLWVNSEGTCLECAKQITYHNLCNRKRQDVLNNRTAQQKICSEIELKKIVMFDQRYRLGGKKPKYKYKTHRLIQQNGVIWKLLLTGKMALLVTPTLYLGKMSSSNYFALTHRNKGYNLVKKSTCQSCYQHFWGGIGKKQKRPSHRLHQQQAKSKRHSDTAYIIMYKHK